MVRTILLVVNVTCILAMLVAAAASCCSFDRQRTVDGFWIYHSESGDCTCLASLGSVFVACDYCPYCWRLDGVHAPGCGSMMSVIAPTGPGPIPDRRYRAAGIDIQLIHEGNTGRCLARIPFRTCLYVLAVPPVSTLGFWAARRWWRWRRGRCPACAYDLTGNVSGTCPECGRHVRWALRGWRTARIGQIGADDDDAVGGRAGAVLVGSGAGELVGDADVGLRDHE